MADLTVGSIRGGVVEAAMPADRFTATASGAVTGGTLVEFVTGDRVVQVAGTTSVVGAGVAIHNAADGEIVTVVTEGVWFLTTHGAVTAGMRLKCYSGGLVADAGATPDARAVIGHAVEDADDGAPVKVKLGGSL